MLRNSSFAISSPKRVGTSSVSLCSCSRTYRWLLAPGCCTPITSFLLHRLFWSRWIPNIWILVFLKVVILLRLTWLLYKHLVINYWLVNENISNILILVWYIIRHIVMLKRSKITKMSDHPIDPFACRFVLIRLFRNPLVVGVTIGDCAAIFVFEFQLRGMLLRC